MTSLLIIGVVALALAEIILLPFIGGITRWNYLTGFSQNLKNKRQFNQVMFLKVGKRVLKIITKHTIFATDWSRMWNYE